MQRRLAELDSARKQFIANASHELRTPIFSLGGFVELLEDEDPSPEERAEFVHTMREQIERLTKLTTDLLDLSQLDAGAIVIVRSDASTSARSPARWRASSARAPTAHGSRLELRTPDRPAVARADPDRVRQIIRILLDNALTHTPEGTKVTVTTHSVNRRAELTVSDEGPGIPQRVQARIFERFYTADSAGGSGLGLAIARELAQRMDGRISITSSKRFTAFTLDLPPAGDAGRGIAGAVRGARVRGRDSPRRGAAGAGGARRLRRRRAGAAARRRPPAPPARRRRRRQGHRRDLRRRLRRRPGLPRGGARRGHDPLDLRRRPPSAAEGSGFVLDTDGEIVTNAHVVTDDSSGDAQAGQGGLRRVPRPQRRPGARSSASTPSPTSPC